MGSGETSPTMSKVHRELMDRVGSPPARAVLLDTPYGFQENADDISARALEYFERSVQRRLEVASFRSSGGEDPVGDERAFSLVRSAGYVFSGPGSPSYALGHWAGTEMVPLLFDKLRSGGCVTFASAAAVTLGSVSLPVYEIYKVGQAPHWLEGLDLVAAAGLPGAVVVPHFNNAEGGNHDTRYCYMGERRLSALERSLPDDAFVLGVDEHTACIVDIDAGTVTIAGLGVVTVRRQGSMTVFASGRTVGLDEILGAGEQPVSPEVSHSGPDAKAGDEKPPLLGGMVHCEAEFDGALRRASAHDAVKAILDLDDLLVEWSRDTTQSDHIDRGRSLLRGMVTRLEEVAERGMQDPRSVVAPLVEALLQSRLDARAGKRWDEADQIRDRLTAAGVEVRDTPTGTEWELA